MKSKVLLAVAILSAAFLAVGGVAFAAGNLPPVISGVSGPVVLSVGQAGTWTISASDPENGVLNYSVLWGEPATKSAAPVVYIQTTTFTHSYTKQGNYTVNFSVKDNVGSIAKSSITVNVAGPTQPAPTPVPISSMKVTSPNGGETLQTGSTQSIIWAKGNVSVASVKIELLKGGVLVKTIVTSTLNNGIYKWAVPTSLAVGNDYYLKISDVKNVNTFDKSDNLFSIAKPVVAPAITNISPAAGVLGAKVTITGSGFTSTGNQTMFSCPAGGGGDTNALSANGKTISTAVISGFPIPVGSQLSYPQKCTVNVSNANGTSKSVSFTITAPPAAKASIAVISPNGGEIWQIGSTQNIAWSSAGPALSNVNIYLYKAGKIAKTIIAKASNAKGTWSWKVPINIAAGNDYKIRVANYAKTTLYDESDNTFSIVKPAAGFLGGVTDWFSSLLNAFGK